MLQLPRDTTFIDLQKDILHNMMSMLREGIIAQVGHPHICICHILHIKLAVRYGLCFEAYWAARIELCDIAILTWMYSLDPHTAPYLPSNNASLLIMTLCLTRQLTVNAHLYSSSHSGPSKIVNIFIYKQNSCNFLTPTTPLPPPTYEWHQKHFWFCHFCMWNQVKLTDLSYIYLMIIKN